MTRLLDDDTPVLEGTILASLTEQFRGVKDIVVTASTFMPLVAGFIVTRMGVTPSVDDRPVQVPYPLSSCIELTVIEALWKNREL
jgi:hypothetical protein